MSKVAIKIKNLSKQYRLGTIGSGTLSLDLKRWWIMKILGREDPNLRIGEINIRDTRADSNYVWALKDINLEIEQGDIVGIIGKNGAGKSTLLKILSKVTAPTTGSVEYRGRLASLLEVGTGFHAEMTGRENIYMNGSIMGMTKAEIKNKLDEIVAFAGIEKFIDTPVKRYSSGMTVRLGFSVAAHLEPEILIVDEVLAVGDAEFQKKAIGKMQDVSKGGGRTVLFVSHNMESIERLCNKAVLLNNGTIFSLGSTKDIINNYLVENLELKSENLFNNDSFENLPIKVLHAYCHDENHIIKESFDITKSIGITFEYEVINENLNFIPAISVENDYGIDVFHSHDVSSNYYQNERQKGTYYSTVWIPKNLMAEGCFVIGLALLTHIPFTVFYVNKNVLRFRVLDYLKGNSSRGVCNVDFPGVLRPKLEWQTKLK